MSFQAGQELPNWEFNYNWEVISNQTITANFKRSKYTLTIDTVGSGEVSQQVVNSARETTEYESGKTIRLSATPQSDFCFTIGNT